MAIAFSDPFLDARSLPDGTTFRADVTIIGAGAAGIVTALSLARKGLDVLLLEGGGLDEAAESQALYDGRLLGLPYHDLGTCRGRWLGGSTNKWAGYLKLPEARDFAPVPGIPLASWPVEFQDVLRYSEEAARFLGLEPEDFELGRLEDRAGVHRTEGLEGGENIRASVVLDEEARRFGTRFREDLRNARGLRVVLNANVTRVGLAPDGQSCDSVAIRTLDGRQLHARSKAFVLACHGIENARLLMASNDVLPSGIGNQSGLLGRYFMDHPRLDSGFLWVQRPERLPETLVLGGGKGFGAFLTAPKHLTDEAQCLQYFLRLIPLAGRARGARGMKRLLTAEWDSTRRLLREVRTVARDPAAAAAGLRAHRGKSPRLFSLNHRIEQAPNLASRVVLSDERDALGNRRAALDWRLSDADYRAFQVGQTSAVRFLRSLGAGPVWAPALTERRILDRVSTYWHHMGTTRMSERPSEGVVDAQCRVHGVDNLFVAGSSVFCRGTLSPPTLTIMGLALRLSAHLSDRVLRRAA